MTLPIDSELFGTVHRKQKINSKVKGNVNELKVTKILQEWTGHEFARVPMSGGLRWKNRMDICGDVINVDTSFNFPFSVETKHLKSLGLTNEQSLRHFDDHTTIGKLRSNSIVWTLFLQCRRDADVVKKVPFLMVRQNGMPEGSYYIFLYLSFFLEMKLRNYVNPVCYYDSFLVDGLNAYSLYGYDSKEFFSKITCDQLKWIFDKK